MPLSPWMYPRDVLGCGPIMFLFAYLSTIHLRLIYREKFVIYQLGE